MQQCLTACDEVQQQHQQQQQQLESPMFACLWLSCCMLSPLVQLTPCHAALLVFILQFPRCNFVINFCHDATENSTPIGIEIGMRIPLRWDIQCSSISLFIKVALSQHDIWLLQKPIYLSCSNVRLDIFYLIYLFQFTSHSN